MNTPPGPPPMTELSGGEALWLLEGSTVGQLAYVRREQAVVRPARHVWEHGLLIVRAPVPATAIPPTATYAANEIDPRTGTGWTVTLTGPIDVLRDPHEAAHYRRTLAGWTHGPHDTLLRVRPQTITGFRLAGAEA
ncbi:pyridoxamine 5'-phosphate oxidase family protein [Streptomyces yunnanensis]|uniref:Pyridoxamine 5'-phosphate oxidase n=1 Tax=Streptomyces yunnanensis TaxID=156453 RepID=A0A9X8N4E5_9ACTN|nr:pyridoxamine 5'-phosphate oxidase family protein [Streptomyces yunnanensis]SHM92285.1 Pyridoxamine 5'-phosphate oxidase [Streptomyces yunnanensis]